LEPRERGLNMSLRREANEKGRGKIKEEKRAAINVWIGDGEAGYEHEKKDQDGKSFVILTKWEGRGQSTCHARKSRKTRQEIPRPEDARSTSE